LDLHENCIVDASSENEKLKFRKSSGCVSLELALAEVWTLCLF